MAKVDIIIRAKDGAELTQACLASFLLSGMDTSDIRIILVQSGEDIVKESGVPWVVNFRSPVPIGAVTATNIGLGISMGSGDAEYVMVLDNDTRIPDGDSTWLERMIAELEAHENTVVVGATSGAVSPPQHCLSPMNTYTGDWQDGERAGAKNSSPVATFISFAVLFKKWVLEEIGYWDTQYDPGNFEDTDYAMAVRKAGYDIRVAQSVFIHHVCHATFGEDMPALMRGNQEKFAEKWGIGCLWDMGIVPDRDIAIMAGRKAGILKEQS